MGNTAIIDILVPLAITVVGGFLVFLNAKLSRATKRIEEKQEHTTSNLEEVKSAVTNGGEDTTLVSDLSDTRERMEEIADSVAAMRHSLRGELQNLNRQLENLDEEVGKMAQHNAHHLAWHQRQAQAEELRARDRDPWEERPAPRQEP